MSKPFRRTLGCLSILTVLMFLNIVFPLQFLLSLSLGWIYFLWITIPKTKIDPGGAIFAVLCLILFSTGTHAFLRWLVSNMRPATESALPRVWKIRWSAAIVAANLLMFVSGMAATGVAHQTGWLIRSPEPLIGMNWTAAQRAQSVNNLKQIGLGLHNYHLTYEQLPPGATFDAHGRALHSWQTLFLPSFESNPLFSRIVLDQPWNAPINRSTFHTMMPTFMNPGIRHRVENFEYAPSDYAANGLIIGGNRGMKLADITDGTSNTIMVGEVVSRTKAWGDPTNWRDVSLGINASPDGFGGPWPGGMNFLMADGSVRFIKRSISLQTLKSLATPKGGEQISSDSY